MKTRFFSILSVLLFLSLPFVYAESLQTGETLDDTANAFGWFVLAMSLFIVLAYITMKIKKRRR